MSNDSNIDSIISHKIIAILRGAMPDDAIKIIEALWNGGIVHAEITMNSPSAIEVIRQAATKFNGTVWIGAGTVLDVRTATDAVSAGAQFIISPSFDKEVITATKKCGAVSIPGAFTPTEIYSAYSAGGDIIKVFPAPAPGYIRDIRGPLSQIRLMPTGGVNLENIADYFKAGAVAVGIGSSLVDTKKPVTNEYLDQITNNAKQFVKKVA